MQHSRVLIYNTLTEPVHDDDGFESIRDYQTLLTRLKENKPFFRLSYRGVNDGSDMETDFDFCCRAVLACRDINFAVEEIGLHSNSWKMPNSLQSIVSAGRHRGISFYCTSQRASNVHPLIRALSTSIISFKQTEPRDLQWLEEVMGEENALKVSQLGIHEKFEWSDTAHSQNTDLDYQSK